MINDFFKDIEFMGFKYSPIYVEAEEEETAEENGNPYEVLIFNESGKPIMDIDLEDCDKNEEPVAILGIIGVKARELARYSWLFDRVNDLMHDLKEDIN